MDNTTDTSDAFIHCELSVHSLRDDLDFNALSYTWGDTQSRKEVVINDATVSITESLEIALRYLRRVDEANYLWVDALCIDQSNDKEKGEQVSHMHEIHSFATRTVVWLGPPADGSALAMKALRETGREAAELGVLGLDTLKISQGCLNDDERASYRDIFEKVTAMAEHIKFNYPFKAARRLGERPYWTRVWVLQDFTLAKSVDIRCGEESLDGDDFGAACLFNGLLWKHLLETHTTEDEEWTIDPAWDYEMQTDEEGNTESRLWQMLRNPPLPESANLVGVRRRQSSWSNGGIWVTHPAALLMDLFERANVVLPGAKGRLGVSVPKDRVFGMLGMLGEQPDFKVVVDYTMSDEEVYTNIARLLLLKCSYRLLTYAGLPRDSNLPSWAPDWRTDFQQPCIENHFFKPGGHLPVTWPIVKDDKTLSIACVVVDIITHIGCEWEPTGYETKFNWTHATPFFREIQHLIETTEPPAASTITKGKWSEGVWRIPIADQYINDIGLRIRAPPAAARGWTLTMQGQRTSEERDKEWQESGINARNYYQIAMGRVRAKRVMQTEKGFVGLAPRSAKLGDIVVIVPGASGPLIMRPGIGDLSLHRIVGEAYVHGVMDGEFVSEETRVEMLYVC